MMARTRRGSASFPHWAPAGIVGLCESALAALDSARKHGVDADSMQEIAVEADVYEKLARDPAMRDVWRALYRQRWRRAESGSGGRIVPGDDGRLVREIVRKLREVRSLSPGTAAARRAVLLKIAERSGALKQLVQNAVNDRIGRGEWCAFEGGGEPSVLFDELDRLAGEATELAQQPEDRIKASRNSEGLSLALRLNNFFEATVGRPLRDHAATIANVVCGSDITKDNIKSALRYRLARRARSGGNRSR